MNEELLEISWGYGAKPTPEQVALMQTYYPEKVIELDADGTIGWATRNAVLTISQACAVGIPFEVKRGTGTMKFKASEELEIRKAYDAPVNQKCNVIVAGNTALLEMDKVHYETDLCTDSLQTLLSDGWRILAICVQPDQRRPDYILGRNSNSPV